MGGMKSIRSGAVSTPVFLWHTQGTARPYFVLDPELGKEPMVKTDCSQGKGGLPKKSLVEMRKQGLLCTETNEY